MENGLILLFTYWDLLDCCGFEHKHMYTIQVDTQQPC